jgi:hypothetical protein
VEPNDPFRPSDVPTCPEIPEALIRHLQAVFPTSLSVKEETQWYYGSKVGNQQVLGHLIKTWREQQSKDNISSVLKQT